MTPLDYYQQKIQEGVISSDPLQLDVMQHFQALQNALVLENQKRESIFAFVRTPKLLKGIYLWGGVGIGKTFMMDCFYHTLPFQNKLRMHFHQFMRMVHDKLTQHQGEADPLEVIAKEIARKTLVLCFDEFFVSDITDAMLLGRLFKALYSRGVCLVATSNCAPDDLYKNGLQRSQFLPAIALLKENTTVLHLTSKADYRLRHLKEAGVFYSPLNKAAEHNMEKTFSLLTQGEKIEYEPVIILGRPIQIKKRTARVVWFDFHEICHVPRSQKDYLAIAEAYKTVFISDVPIIESNQKDLIVLFISLVDVLYDARIKLVISSAEPLEQMYNKGYTIMEYTRTHSRLQEMQSLDYFTNEYSHDNTR